VNFYPFANVSWPVGVKHNLFGLISQHCSKVYEFFSAILGEHQAVSPFLNSRYRHLRTWPLELWWFQRDSIQRRIADGETSAGAPRSSFPGLP
jgi:hypothetical protein